MIDGDDPGCSSPRPLRGFRRRWTDLGSVAAASQVGSSEQDFDANANLPEFTYLDWTCSDSLAIQTASMVGRLSMRV